jgi:hypothetical protein
LALPKDILSILKDNNNNYIPPLPGLKPAPIELYSVPVIGENEYMRDSPFLESYFNLLEKMAEFLINVSKSDGIMSQIGDNDSGRILKLSPKYEYVRVKDATNIYKNLNGYSNYFISDKIFIEVSLDFKHLIASIDALFKREDFSQVYKKEDYIEYSIITTLINNITIRSYRDYNHINSAENISIGENQIWSQEIAKLNSVPEGIRNEYVYSSKAGNIRHNLKRYGYPAFGLYIFNSDFLYLSVRCGGVGQVGLGGHAHNDQLSVELNIDGADLLYDPGSYLYTPFPEIRNKYRSVKAHFSPHVNGLEPCSLQEGIFLLTNSANATCRYFGDEGFIGYHTGYGEIVMRYILILDNTIRIVDYSKLTLSRIEQRVPYSPGYGWILR